MKKISVIVISFFLILSITPEIQARKAGNSSVLFLNMPVSPAAAAMGGVYSSLADDVNSIFFNPAGLGLISSSEFTFMHNSYIEDLKHDYAAVCLPLAKNKNAIGMSYNSFDAGNFDRMFINNGVTPVASGQFSARDYALALSFGHKINILVQILIMPAPTHALEILVCSGKQPQIFLKRRLCWHYPLKISVALLNMTKRTKVCRELIDFQ